MKKSIIFLMSVLVLGMASCDKVPTVPTQPTPASGPTPPTPTFTNSDGVLASIIMTFSQKNPNIPIPIEIQTDIALAVFPTSQGGSNYADAGSVSLNAIGLEKAENNSYLKSATMGLTPASLDFDNGSKWSVAQLGIDYNHDVAFPKYSGDLPSSITKANGMSVDLAGTISGSPDSIILVIVTPNNNLMKTVGGNSASVSFSANELSGLSAISDNTAYLEVVPYKVTTKQISGKTYHFIKEQAAVATININ